MNRRNVLGIAATSGVGLLLHAAGASAQQSAGVEAIKAANQAFYAALSARDIKAMEALWANKPYVVNIGPRSKTIANYCVANVDRSGPDRRKAGLGRWHRERRTSIQERG